MDRMWLKTGKKLTRIKNRELHNIGLWAVFAHIGKSQSTCCQA
jgi:hypothetical protein